MSKDFPRSINVAHFLHRSYLRIFGKFRSKRVVLVFEPFATVAVFVDFVHLFARRLMEISQNSILNYAIFSKILKCFTG